MFHRINLRLLSSREYSSVKMSDTYNAGLFVRLNLDPTSAEYQPFSNHLIEELVDSDQMLACLMTDTQTVAALDIIGHGGPRAMFKNEVRKLLGLGASFGAGKGSPIGEFLLNSTPPQLHLL